MVGRVRGASEGRRSHVELEFALLRRELPIPASHHRPPQLRSVIYTPAMSSTASPTPEDPAVATLRATLGKVYRLSTSDGRTFEGAFICIDRERNIILQDALESSQQDDTPPREVGMVSSTFTSSGLAVLDGHDALEEGTRSS